MDSLRCYWQHHVIYSFSCFCILRVWCRSLCSSVFFRANSQYCWKLLFIYSFGSFKSDEKETQNNSINSVYKFNHIDSNYCNSNIDKRFSTCSANSSNDRLFLVYNKFYSIWSKNIKESLLNMFWFLNLLNLTNNFCNCFLIKLDFIYFFFGAFILN